MNTKLFFIAFGLAAILAQRVINPPSSSLSGNGAPSSSVCTAATPGLIYVQLDAAAGEKVWTCAAGSWDQQGTAGITPSGVTVMITSGTCATGYTEVAGLNGKTLWGTVAANSDVGGTGGNDTITPAGTNASVSAGTPSGTNGTVSFTPAGSVSAHTHGAGGYTALAQSWLLNGTYTPLGVINTVDLAATGVGGAHAVSNAGGANPTFTGTAATNLDILGTNTGSNVTGTSASTTPTFTGNSGTVPAETFTGSALGTHTHTFTGNSFDNRSAFEKVIFCSKN